MDFLLPLAPPVFAAGDVEGWRQSIGEHGFAAVRVMDEGQAAARLRDFDAWLAGLPAPPVTFRGIVNSYGIGQAAFMWKIRLAVAGVFAALWGAAPADLLTSFDGALCAEPVARHTPRAFWPHIDQSPVNREFSCVQAAVYLAGNTGEQDGGLVVWPGSHLANWPDLIPHSAGVKKNFFSIPPGFGLGPGRILRAPAGTLVLWESRLVHMGLPPLAPAGRRRAVAYVCMTPRLWASEGVLRKRQLYFETHRTTTHLPHRVTVCADSPRFPRSGGSDPRPVVQQLQRAPPDLADLSPADLPLIRRLVGYT